MRFAYEADLAVLEYARLDDAFAGAYFDQVAGGRLVVLLTHSDRDLEDAMRSRMPSASRGLEFVYVPVSYERLMAAFLESQSAWDQEVSSVPLVKTALDVRLNAIRFDVPAEFIGKAREHGPSLQALLGVPVAFAEGEPEELQEQVCGSRGNCHTPFRAGIRIIRGSYQQSNPVYCTMGFHIRIGSDEQVLTAGHCGYQATPDYWSHGGCQCVVGTESGNQYHLSSSPNFGRDAMKMGMADSQASNKVYGEGSTPIVDARNPVTGEAICSSQGYSDDMDCGQVADATVHWPGSLCACEIYGADASSIFGESGDSGSPVYKLVGSSGIVAVGIWNTAGGGFARLGDVLGHWTAFIVT